MDLADTPAIPSRKAQAQTHAQQQPERLRDRETTVRVVSPMQAHDPVFLEGWRRLADNAAEPNPFFEPWFLLPSLDHLDSDQDCMLLTTWSRHRMTGLIPVVRSKDYYGYHVPHVAVWLHDNAFCGTPLVEGGFERVFWHHLLGFLDHAPGRAMFLHCSQLTADGPLNAALDAVLSDDMRYGVTTERAERAMLSSTLNAQDYLAEAMSTKKRKELRRQHKRLGEEGDLCFERQDDSAKVDAWIAEFLALEARGWKGDAGSALNCSGDTRDFFKGTLQGAADAGRLERLALRLDGKPIAMLTNFTAQTGMFSFKTTFDEAYARFSPGLLLQLENLALLDREDIQWADSCAVEGHSMIERIWREKRSIVSRNVAIGGPLRRAAFRALAAYETRGSKGS